MSVEPPPKEAKASGSKKGSSKKDEHKEEQKVEAKATGTPEVPAGVTYEQVLTTFADRVNQQLSGLFQGLQYLADVVKKLSDKVEELDRRPRGEVAAALEAQAKTLQPIIQQALQSPPPSLADLVEVVKLAQGIAPVSPTKPEEPKKSEEPKKPESPSPQVPPKS